MAASPHVQRLSVPARGLQIVCVATMFLFYGLGGLVFSWLILPLARLYMWRRSEGDRIRGFQKLVGPTYRWFMIAMRWLGFLTFDNREIQLGLEGPTVVVANHPTLIDSPAFLSVEPNLICVVKPSFASSLVFSRTLRYCGFVTAGSAEETIAAVVERLKMGFSVLIFPEGTRSPPGELGKLLRGAFEMAKAADAPILPVVVTCSPPALTHGMAWHEVPPKPAQYQFQVGQQTEMSEWEGNSRKAAAHHQEFFHSALTSSPSQSNSPATVAA